MKNCILFISTLFLSNYSFSQTYTSIYSQGVCNCIDTSGGVDKSLINCIDKSIRGNMKLFNQDILKQGDTSKNAITQLYNDIILRVEIELIGTCTSFFKYIDSLEQLRYRNLNRDSLKELLIRLDGLSEDSRKDDYYKMKANLYVEIGDYDNATKLSEMMLQRDSLSEMGLLIKAMVQDKTGNYTEAISLYDKVAAITKSNSILILSALAKAKRDHL